MRRTARGLPRAEPKHAAWDQRLEQNLVHPGVQFRVEVDQHIATQNEIERIEAGIGCEVVPGEYDSLTERPVEQGFLAGRPAAGEREVVRQGRGAAACEVVMVSGGDPVRSDDNAAISRDCPGIMPEFRDYFYVKSARLPCWTDLKCYYICNNVQR